MTMRRILLVARQGFIEQLRERVWFGVAASIVLLSVTALAIGPLTAGQQVKVVKDLGLALVELAGAVVAVAMGVNLIAREADRRSILSVLSKPLPRWEFVVGKYVGLMLALLTIVTVMGIALCVVLAFAGGADVRLTIALAMIAAELSLLTAVALFFSAFSSSAAVSIVMTVGVFVAGQLSADLRSFTDVADAPAWMASVAAVIGWALPDFSRFDLKSAVVHGQPIAGGVVALTLLYGALYATALVSGAIALFARREFR